MKTNKNILIISSSSKTGGGPSHIFTLNNLIKNEVNIFYAMPYTQNLENI